MRKDVLLGAQRRFLEQYPDGFENPELVALGKKYKMVQHGEFATEHFAKARFKKPDEILDAMATLASRSAMVSMFEKPKLKSAVAGLDPKDIKIWCRALNKLLHGDQEKGFDELVEALAAHKLAKWTLVTVVPAYFAQQAEVFVKPSTAKLIIDQLGLDLTYKPAPTWEFYAAFRDAVVKMRKTAKAVKAPNNAAFTGFLMMSLNDEP